MSLQQIGKLLFGLGLLLIITGGLIWLADRVGIRRLPGDIIIRRGNFTLYFPIVTSIAISLILSFIAYIISRLK